MSDTINITITETIETIVVTVNETTDAVTVEVSETNDDISLTIEEVGVKGDTGASGDASITGMDGGSA